MTYQELRALITSYMHRTDLDAVIPDFIEQARTRINRDVRLGEMLTLTTFTPTSNPFDAPSDFLEARELTWQSGTRRVALRLSPRWQLSEYSAATQSKPQFYSVDGKRIETAPGGVDIEYRLLYYAALEAFVNDSDTNEVLNTYPSLYLYGALIEAFSYTQDNELRSAAVETYVSEAAAANKRAHEAEAGAALQMTGSSSWL